MHKITKHYKIEGNQNDGRKITGYSSFPEIRTDNYCEDDKNYIFDIPLEFQPDERGLGNHLFNCMRKYRNSIAQVITAPSKMKYLSSCGVYAEVFLTFTSIYSFKLLEPVVTGNSYIAETDEQETYDIVLKRCILTALYLQSRNLTKEDVIYLCSYNQKFAIVPFIASLFLTVPIASLDPILSLLDVSHLLKEVKPKILFLIPEVVELVEAALKEAGVDAEIVVFGETDKYTEFLTFLEPHEDKDKFTPVPVESLNDTSVIVFSSGTTGLPKGIVLSHYALMVQGHVLLKSGNIGTVTLYYATLYWASAVVLLIAVVQSGNAKLLCKKFDPKEIWYLIDRYKVSFLFLAPSLVIGMLKAGRPDDIDTASLYCCIIGGASIHQNQLLELRDILPGSFVFQGYGQSEVAGILTLFKTNSIKDTLFLHNKPKSIGVPIPGTKYKVVEPDTERLCGPNEHGELRVKSEAIMTGYYNRDSSESYDSSGWLKTGDIVYYDEDGCFYIVDRIKEMLKYRSFQIPPAMIEQIIMTHPSVFQAVVIGIPHEEDGDHPIALIIPNNSCNGNIDEEEIKSYVEDRVHDRMRLRGGVRIISSFPMTPSGKIRRKDLRDMVLKGDV